MTKAVTITVTDNSGRTIEVRKLKALDRLRFFQLIGGENAANPGYMGIAIFAYAVTAIDGKPVPVPTTRVALEGMVKRLDDDGINAISEAVMENFMPAEADEKRDKEDVKN